MPARALESVRSYYTFVAKREYSSAYGLMASRITTTTDIGAFQKWFANKRSMDLRDAWSERETNTDALIAARATSSDRFGDAEQVVDYIDRWTVVLERGLWRLSSVETILASGVSTATAAELRQAVIDYDHLEEKAYAADDPEVVRTRATSNIVAQLKRTFDRNRSAGDHEITRLEGITFRGFRQPAESRADVDAVETWSSVHYDRQGRVIKREPPSPLYMTMHFVRQGGVWLLDNTDFYKDNPFAN